VIGLERQTDVFGGTLETE